MGPWQPLHTGDPEHCGGFRLTHRLGDGGFGTVFLGFRPDVSVPVAVKVFRSEYAGSELWRRRFLREIELIKEMAGVHTAALVDSGGRDTPPWLATRYVHAPSLDRLVHLYGAFDHLCAWWLATGIGEALAEIHAKGILHRDLKPQNILVEQTGVKIIDFGISRFTSGPGLTADSTFFGTHQYTANEHLLDPREASEKSDVFALGAVLVYATTGRTPFQGIPPSERLAGRPPNLDGVPDELYDLVESCLATNAEHRPTALTVFRTALGHLADFAVPLASETGLPLPPEIRDFLDEWRAVPIPVPELAVAASGSAELGSTGSPRSGGASATGPARTPEARPGKRPNPAFDAAWLSRWRSAAERRRDRYGGRRGPDGATDSK
ncbi:MAG: serine/threonine protein kinase [Micromonosporaceae bacterium]